MRVIFATVPGSECQPTKNWMVWCCSVHSESEKQLRAAYFGNDTWNYYELLKICKDATIIAPSSTSAGPLRSAPGPKLKVRVEPLGEQHLQSLCVRPTSCGQKLGCRLHASHGVARARLLRSSDRRGGSGCEDEGRLSI